MTPAEYRDRLHACLDARRDPLDDEAVCAFLAGHPDELERFAALRQRLATLRQRLATLPACLEHRDEGVPRRPRRRRLPLLLGGMAAAAIVAIVFAPGDGSAATYRAGNGRVLAASLAPLPSHQHAAATFSVRERFAAGPGSFLETFELRSQLR